MAEFKIVGSSMLPNLSPGQIVTGQLRPILLGDVVFFLNPKTEAASCKRVCGLQGQVVRIAGNRVYLDGNPAPEASYDVLYGSGRETLANMKAIKVPRLSVYVLGDNRPCSADSRAFGCIPNKSLIAVMDARSSVVSFR